MIGKFLCRFGLHKWKPIPGTKYLEHSGWDTYEHAEGECIRADCDAKTAIRREVY